MNLEPMQMKRGFVLSLLAGSVALYVAGTTAHAPRDAGSGQADAACSAGPGAPGEACSCSGACVDEARCVKTNSYSVDLSVCTSVSSGECVCGAVFDDRCQNGATCVCPGGDDTGLCLTPEQKAVLCTGDLARMFNCQDNPTGDAAPGTVP